MPLRGVREVKTHAAARRVWSQVARAARRVRGEDARTPLRGVWEVKTRTHAAARHVRREEKRRCAACEK